MYLVKEQWKEKKKEREKYLENKTENQKTQTKNLQLFLQIHRIEILYKPVHVYYQTIWGIKILI